MVYIFIFFTNPFRRKLIKSSFDKQTEGTRNEGKAPARVASYNHVINTDDTMSLNKDTANKRKGFLQEWISYTLQTS